MAEKKKSKASSSPKAVHVKLDNPSVTTAEHYVRMVGVGDLLGCMLIGPAGMGKTHMVRHILDDLAVDYTVYGGHITLAEVYEFLYEHSDELIFFDDVSQVINKVEIMEMLKQALNLSGNDRVLHYRSKNVLSHGVENSFVFSGRIIFAFNTMDKKNPNVKAIMDRAPLVELKFNRAEIIAAMYKIAAGDAGGLMEYEKMIVVREIEDYTDSTMDVSLRKLFLAFNIYRSFKKMYGEGNEFWANQVQLLFGKRKESWMRTLVRTLVGYGKISRKELAKEIAIQRDMSPRNAHRKINEFLEIEEIFQNKLKFGDVSIKPFTGGKK
jgi:replication-associated recombination protein RarA|tara:strand:+ start:2557 stop:3528 length:972 start_codon:yes stop_codon:yes gene_type:complete